MRRHLIYLTVAASLFFYEILQTTQGFWIGDFWEHAAVVNEMSQHLLHPSHPIFQSDKDHCFFSPYSLLVGSTRRFAGFTSIHMLEIFGLLNLAFFLFSFRFFCGRLFQRAPDLSSSIALVFMLLFWGQEAPRWSGFFHLNTLHYVLAYPSMWCMGAGFLILGVLLPGYRYRKLLLAILPLTVVLLSHPQTWLWISVAILTGAFFYSGEKKIKIVATLLCLAASFTIALAWPYYRLLELFSDKNLLFHTQSKELYNGLLLTYWPFLILPFYVLWKRNSVHTNWLLASSAIMAVIYIAGFISKQYGIARIIAACAICMQLLMAGEIIYFFQSDLKRKITGAITVLVLSVTAFINVRNDRHVLNVFRTPDKSYYTRYFFLNPFCEKSLVLADHFSNTILPSLGIRVIGWDHPLFNMVDQNERNKLVNDFYQECQPANNLLKLINTYHPDYLLVDSVVTGNGENTFLQPFNTKLVVKKNGLSLYRLN